MIETQRSEEARPRLHLRDRRRQDTTDLDKNITNNQIINFEHVVGRISEPVTEGREAESVTEKRGSEKSLLGGEVVWKVSGRYLEEVLNVFERCRMGFSRGAREPGSHKIFQLT